MVTSSDFHSASSTMTSEAKYTICHILYERYRSCQAFQSNLTKRGGNACPGRPMEKQAEVVFVHLLSLFFAKKDPLKGKRCIVFLYQCTTRHYKSADNNLRTFSDQLIFVLLLLHFAPRMLLWKLVHQI